MNTIGIVSPGAMGSALGQVWRAGGAHVVCTVAGRSERTRRLADGLDWLPDLDAVVRTAEVIVSVGPPALATEMAATIAAACVRADVHPVVADVNAVSPETMAAVAGALTPAGCAVVDGAISGPPPSPDGAPATTLYLSGADAFRLAELAAPGLRTVVVGPRIGSASAVKMCTASMYKGFTGLLLQALRTAQANDVLDHVVADLRSRFPQVGNAAAEIASAVAKSDRYPGEMAEIARTQAEAGGRGELFEAFALVYQDAHGTALAAHTPEQASRRADLTGVLAELEQSTACALEMSATPAEPARPQRTGEPAPPGEPPQARN